MFCGRASVTAVAVQERFRRGWKACTPYTCSVSFCSHIASLASSRTVFVKYMLILLYPNALSLRGPWDNRVTRRCTWLGGGDASQCFKWTREILYRRADFSNRHKHTHTNNLNLQICIYVVAWIRRHKRVTDPRQASLTLQISLHSLTHFLTVLLY